MRIPEVKLNLGHVYANVQIRLSVCISVCNVILKPRDLFSLTEYTCAQDIKEKKWELQIDKFRKNWSAINAEYN